jgi:PadR family transcriptional regulator, regulatory protein PadR
MPCFLLETKTTGRETKNGCPAGRVGINGSQTLDVLGPPHGNGIARRIEISGDLLGVLAVNKGTVYSVLLKVDQERARLRRNGMPQRIIARCFYRLTRGGRKQLQVETQEWERTAAIIGCEVNAEDLS